VVPQGPQHISKLLVILADPRIPASRRGAHRAERHGGLARALEQQVETLDKTIRARSCQTDRAAADTIPGFGPFSAAIRDRRDHDTSTAPGLALARLVPRQDGTGGKVKLGRSANAATDTCAACW